MKPIAARTQLIVLALIVLGIFVQVYLIAAYIFNAGSGALHAHEDIGNLVLALEIVSGIAGIVAWRGTPLLGMSIALPVIGIIQIVLAQGSRWIGGLHGFFALIVLGLAISLAIRIRRESGAAPFASPPATS